MITITYNPETHRLVPVEPTEEMFEQMVTALCVADGHKKAVLVAHAALASVKGGV